jgi:hypothetical protein
MNRFAFISAALLLAAPATAQDKAADSPAQEGPAAPGGKLENLLQNCDAHKFETTVDSVVDGQPHRSKVKMCGTEGQSDSDWIGTLNDAIAKLEANKEMPTATRDQIVSAIKAEIARLNAASEMKVNDTLPPGRATASPEPLSNDYSVLPPLPNTAPPPPRVLPRAVEAATGAAPAVAAPPKPAMANPRLRFSCMNPDYPGGGPCVTLTRGTVVTVTAPDAVPAGLSLRFVRQGDDRAEVALGAVRKGGNVRLTIPRPVCSGVVTSEVEMRVVGGGQVLDRQGPFLLRC